MSHYRLYLVDVDGRVMHAADFEADDDHGALSLCV